MVRFSTEGDRGSVMACSRLVVTVKITDLTLYLPALALAEV
jgi:hypothetical protein